MLMTQPGLQIEVSLNDFLRGNNILNLFRCWSIPSVHVQPSRQPLLSSKSSQTCRTASYCLHISEKSASTKHCSTSKSTQRTRLRSTLSWIMQTVYYYLLDGFTSGNHDCWQPTCVSIATPRRWPNNRVHVQTTSQTVDKQCDEFMHFFH